MELLQTWWQDENGQDLIEYTLLITFVVFVTAGVMGIGTASVKGIVSTSNSQITAASRIAGG
jgi:Flp pilus assembly pilin Flp